jgi:hypothetical protein
MTSFTLEKNLGTKGNFPIMHLKLQTQLYGKFYSGTNSALVANLFLFYIRKIVVVLFAPAMQHR